MSTFARASAIVVVTLALVFASRASAALLNVTGHTNDATLWDSNLNGVGDSTFELTSARLLAGGGGSGHFTGIMYFQLPAVGMNQFIAGADLKLTVTADQNTTAANRADVYGLGYITTTPATTIPNAWFYQGANDTRSGNTLVTNIGSNPVTKIADDFLLGGNSIILGTAFNTSGSQDIVLKNYLDALYAQGAQAGDYAVLRLNLDATPVDSPPNAIRFEIGSSNNTTSAYRPLLTFDIQDVVPAPEPSSLLLLSMGVCGLRSMRRRKHA
jgi:hypothetical protein